MEKIERVGLLAGEGKLPIIFADEARKRQVKVIAFAAKDIASPELESHVDKIYWLDLSEVMKLPFILLTNRIKKLVMLGKIPKSVFFKRDFSRDEEINSLLRDSESRMDDSLLREVAKKAKKLGLTFINPRDFLSDFLPKKGTLTKRSPTAKEWENIEFGKEMARALGRLDIGQTVVVQNKAILTVEAIEGTDETISRSARYSKGGTIVVKMIKPNQDLRFDIPTVGMETVNSLIKVRASVLAIEAEKTFFVDREKSIAKADEYNISIVAI